jgi:hypothetical protein
MYWRTPWQTQGEMYLMFALGAVGVGVVVSLGLFFRERYKGRTLHARLDHFSTALTLLSDTMETSLRDVGLQLARLDAPAPPEVVATRRPDTQGRVRGALRLGRTVQEIAAAEEMSESEVVLMLKMSLENAMERANHADLH